MKAVLFILALSVLIGSAFADQYLHMPRGSNNRLNEANAQRNNGDRLFDSQNNNRGGYNVGDSTDEAATTTAEQFRQPFYEGSILSIEWTNQHACGSNRKVRCEHILQYLCDDSIRDGTTTNTPSENDDDGDATGRHESRQYYADCRDNIERNKGLWTADQNLNGDTAIYTRQNPNGNRRGYECPEERDYYPWWHDNPWKDIVIHTSEPKERCDWYKAALKSLGRPDDIPCEMAVWSRDNHLGNTLNGQMASFNWTLPSTQEACGKDTTCKCVFRIRYNISTTDVDWFINSTYNDDLSPLQQNPTVDIGVMQGFRLAINTAQTGRTFQDRSHVFLIEPRPAGATGKIYNVVVRGKRGNIVETFPAIEYDFVPNKLKVSTDDWVQFQWTGSNTHNNGGNGGDGQTGDSGQGRGGTDRSNIVQIDESNVNYPTPTTRNSMWKNVRASLPQTSEDDLIMEFASSGAGADVDPLLNDAPASFVGPLLKFKPGEYHYMSTRNNNFSNRSQKGVLTVTN